MWLIHKYFGHDWESFCGVKTEIETQLGQNFLHVSLFVVVVQPNAFHSVLKRFMIPLKIYDLLNSVPEWLTLFRMFKRLHTNFHSLFLIWGVFHFCKNNPQYGVQGCCSFNMTYCGFSFFNVAEMVKQYYVDIWAHLEVWNSAAT